MMTSKEISMIKLLLKVGNSTEERIFRDPIITIGVGDDKKFDLSLQDPILEGECLQIISDEDLKSSVINLSDAENLVTVNEQPFETTNLNNGDILKIGNNILIFENLLETTRNLIDEVDDIILNKVEEEPEVIEEEPVIIEEEELEVIEEDELEVIEEKEPEIIVEEPEIIVEEEPEIITPPPPPPKKSYYSKIFLFLFFIFVIGAVYFYNSKESPKEEIAIFEEPVPPPPSSDKRIKPGLPGWVNSEVKTTKKRRDLPSKQYEEIKLKLSTLSTLYVADLQQIEGDAEKVTTPSDRKKMFDEYRKLEFLRRHEITSELDLLYAKFLSLNDPGNFYDLVRSHDLEIFMSPGLKEQLTDTTEEDFSKLENAENIVELDNILQAMTLKKDIQKIVFKKLDHFLNVPHPRQIDLRLKSYAAIEHILNNAEITENYIRDFYINEFSQQY